MQQLDLFHLKGFDFLKYCFDVWRPGQNKIEQYLVYSDTLQKGRWIMEKMIPEILTDIKYKYSILLGPRIQTKDEEYRVVWDQNIKTGCLRGYRADAVLYIKNTAIPSDICDMLLPCLITF